MDTFELLEKLVTNLIEYIPRLVGALIIFIIGWIISKFIARMIKKVLAASGVDKLSDKLNEIEIISKANVNVLPSDALSKIVYYFMLLIFGVAATDVLGMPVISDLIKSLVAYMPLLVSGIFIFVIGSLIAEFFKNIVHTTCSAVGIPAAKVIASFVFYFVFVSAIMLGLEQAEIQTDFLKNNLTVVIAGGVFAFAIGYGLASRELMSNFLASFYSKNRFNIGDVISIAEAKGEIIEMDTNTITLQSEGKKIVFPLKVLTSEKIEIYNK